MHSDKHYYNVLLRLLVRHAVVTEVCLATTVKRTSGSPYETERGFNPFAIPFALSIRTRRAAAHQWRAYARRARARRRLRPRSSIAPAAARACRPRDTPISSCYLCYNNMIFVNVSSYITLGDRFVHAFSGQKPCPFVVYSYTAAKSLWSIKRAGDSKANGRDDHRTCYTCEVIEFQNFVKINDYIYYKYIKTNADLNFNSKNKKYTFDFIIIALEMNNHISGKEYLYSETVITHAVFFFLEKICNNFQY